MDRADRAEMTCLVEQWADRSDCPEHQPQRKTAQPAGLDLGQRNHVVLGISRLVLAGDNRVKRGRIGRAVADPVAGFELPQPEEHSRGEDHEADCEDHQESDGDLRRADRHGCGQADIIGQDVAVQRERPAQANRQQKPQQPQSKQPRSQIGGNEALERRCNRAASAGQLIANRNNRRGQRIGMAGRELAAHRVEPVERAHPAALAGENRLDLCGQRRLRLDPADAHARRAAMADAGAGTQAEPCGDDMPGEIAPDVTAAPVARQCENLRQLRPHRQHQLGDGTLLIAVGRKFEDQVRLVGGEAGQRVHAGEMDAEGTVQWAEPGGEVRARRIAKRVDCRLRCGQHGLIERRNDGDHRLVHAGRPFRWRSRWAGNGPAQRILPSRVGCRSSSALTSIGICHALTPRPAHGCSPPPRCK